MISRRSFLLGSAASNALTLSYFVLGPRPILANEIVPSALPKGLSPHRSSSTAFIEVAKGLVDEKTNNQEFWRSSPNTYLQNLERLDQELRQNERKARYGTLFINSGFEALETGLEFARTTAPAPTSYYVWGIENLVKEQKRFIIGSIEQKRKEVGQELAQAAANRMRDSRRLPYASLYPVNNPALAVENMKEAAKDILLSNGSLGEDQKAILFRSMFESMVSMYEAGALKEPEGDLAHTTNPNYLDESAQKLNAAAGSLQDIASNEIELAEKGTVLAETNAKAESLVRKQEPVPQDLTKQLEDFANSVIELSGVSQDVVAAAVALGLSPEVGEKINFASSVASQGAKAALAFASGDPLSMISATSQLITGIFGRGSSGPEVYLQEIFEALQDISEQLADIQAMQRKILQNIQTIQDNQLVTAQLQQNTIREVQTNRQLIIDLAEGPLKLLQREVDRFGLNVGLRNGFGPGLSYEAYWNIFDASGDLLIAGMRQLEGIFSSRETPHLLLQEATYFGQDQVEANVEDSGIRLSVELNERADKALEYHARLKQLEDRRVPPFLFSEAGNMMGVLFPKALVRSDIESISQSSVTPLIEVGMLLKIGWLACSTYHLHEFLTFDGDLRMMTKEELLDDDTQRERGYLVLEDLFRWVNTAIHQQLILGDGYDRAIYLTDLANGNPELQTDVPFPYMFEQPVGRHFPDIQYTISSLRFGKGHYDPRWVNEIYMVLARGYHEHWENCDGIPRRECDLINAGWPDYEEYKELEEKALGVLSDLAPFSISTPEYDPYLQFDVKFRYFPITEDADATMYLSDQFSDLEINSWFDEGPLLPQSWPSQTVTFFAPWVRAELSGRNIKEQLEYEANSPVSASVEPGRRDEECERDVWVTLFDTGCPTPSSWVAWATKDEEEINEQEAVIEFADLDLHRDFETGRFSPEVEALLQLKDVLLRHLTPYRLYKEGNIDLKAKLIEAVMLERPSI